MPFVTMTRPALGQVASLGDLYDARTDTFSAISLFTKTPAPSAITSIDNHSSTIKYVHTESYKEKFDHFGISSQLSASVAAGMVSVGGSGRYLTTRRDTKLTVESSLIYNITTVIERVNFQLQDLDECLALDTLKDDIATHVVADISWGSRNIVTVRQAISREDDANVMTGNLDARLKSINASAGVDLTKASSATVLDNSFDVTVEGDVVATDGSVPRDLAGVEAYIGNVPKYISATNGGKGKPLFYCLLPLSDLARLLKVQIAKEITLRELSSQCADQFVQAFDEIVSIRQDINDYRSLLWSHREYISQDDFCACTDALFKLRTSETRLREQYKKAISNVRAGKEDEVILWEVLNEFKNSGISLNRLIKFALGH
ncbi:hypothetical protein BJX65DRAFT_313943 [Aspergillus insuetus]